MEFDDDDDDSCFAMKVACSRETMSCDNDDDCGSSSMMTMK